MSKIVYFILSENEIHIGTSQDNYFQWIEKQTFSNKTDYYYKEQLQELLDKHQLSSANYDEHILMWYSHQSTLVPMNMLENSTPKELLYHSFSENKIQHDVDYNRISELSVVNIYEIPLWVKSFFVIRFPRIVLQHLGTGMLRGIFNGSSFKPNVRLVLTEDFALLIYVKHGELITYTSFEYATESDLIYHTLNVLTQTDSLNNSGIIEIHTLRENKINTTTFVENWSKLKEVSDFKVEFEPTQTLKYLSVCV